MIFYNSRRQPIHMNGKLAAGKYCPCSDNPCKDNQCIFHPEYSSVFAMGRAGGFLELLTVNSVVVTEGGKQTVLPMTFTSPDNIPPDPGNLTFWYDPSVYIDPETGIAEGKVDYTVSDIINGAADINSLSVRSNWMNESRFYLADDHDTRYLTISAEYSAKPENWTISRDQGGKYERLFMNKFQIFYYHWIDGELVAAPGENYTARIFRVNLTNNFVLIDSSIAAGAESFGGTIDPESYKDRYDTRNTPFDQIALVEPDFMNYRWVGNGLITGGTIHYAIGSHRAAELSSFSFQNDPNLKVGYYTPSIDYCDCGDDTISYGDPVPPEDPPTFDFNPPSLSSSASGSGIGSGSFGSMGSGSTLSIPESKPSTPSNTSEPSEPSEPSMSLSISSVSSSGSAESVSSVPSVSLGSDDLVYVLFATEYACAFDSNNTQIYILQATGEPFVYDVYSDPADLPYSDGWIERSADGWALLFEVVGPVIYDQAVASPPPMVLGECIPDHPDCSDMEYPFPVGVIESHSYEFTAPTSLMMVVEFTPPTVIDDNGNSATFEAYLIDTVDWSEEIRFTQGSQIRLGHTSYSLEIRCRGTVTSTGKITFRFCPTP